MTELTEKRTMAFVGAIAGRCHSCLRCSPENCRNCLSQWAKEIMADYNAEEKQSKKHLPPEPDYSLSARMMLILDALENSEDPLPSDRIDLKDLCTPQLKQWTLKHMRERGIIGRRPLKAGEGRGNSQWGYYIADRTRLPVL